MQDVTRQQRSRKKRNKIVKSQNMKSTVGIHDATTHGRELNKEEVLVSDALERIMSVRTRTMDLYASWNTQLLRLSFLVLFMAFYQSYGPFQQVKAAFELNRQTKQQLSSLISNVSQKHLLELFHILLSLAILVGLRIQIKRFKYHECGENESWKWCCQWPFLTSTMLTVITVYLYWLKPTYVEIVAEKAIQKEFPVSVVFYLIVTGAYSFMSAGLKPTEDNLLLLRKLRNRLKNEEQKNNNECKFASRKC